MKIFLFCFVFVFYLARGCCWSFSSRTTDGWLDWDAVVGTPTETFRSGDKNAGYSIGCGIITFLENGNKVKIIQKSTSKISVSYHFWITLFYTVSSPIHIGPLEDRARKEDRRQKYWESDLLGTLTTKIMGSRDGKEEKDLKF